MEENYLVEMKERKGDRKKEKFMGGVGKNLEGNGFWRDGEICNFGRWNEILEVGMKDVEWGKD